VKGIKVELYSGDHDLGGLRFRTEQDSRPHLKSLGLSRRRIIPLHDGLHPQHLLNGGSNQATAQIHGQRLGLERRHGAEAVDDHAGNAVALAPEDATDERIDPETIAESLSPLEAAAEKIGIEILSAV